MEEKAPTEAGASSLWDVAASATTVKEDARHHGSSYGPAEKPAEKKAPEHSDGHAAMLGALKDMDQNKSLANTMSALMAENKFAEAAQLLKDANVSGNVWKEEEDG